MGIESCENIPEEIHSEVIDACNAMDESLSDINPDITYTLDKNWYTWEDSDIVIQLKNHSNNAWARIAVPIEHLGDLNRRILQLISNPSYPYSNDDNETIFSQTSHHEVVDKLRHLWLID